jgi:uracil-DNA glycosylase
VIRCAPPANRPLPGEILNCREYLLRERALLPRLCVVVALGKLAFDEVLRLHELEGATPARPRPRFGHLARAWLPGWGATLIGSYHPSQQNTFTGKLTRPMFDAVFRAALRARDRSPRQPPAAGPSRTAGVLDGEGGPRTPRAAPGRIDR